MSRSFYESRGVSASKPDVKEAIRKLDPGLYPGAFCKIVPDFLAASDEHCVLAHSDGAGTKSVLAYLHYRKHGNAGVFKGIAQDSLVMNLDDLLCVGSAGPFLYSNTIGRNAKHIPGEVIKAVIDGYEEFAERLRPYGIAIHACGGETADVGDLVRTLIVDSSVTCRMRRADVVDCSRVKPGQVIVGFASAGKASYESEENSGIGTNGFTAVRHSLFKPEYQQRYAEAADPSLGKLAYCGASDLDDPLPGTDRTLADACLSPTRTYAPIVLAILKEHRHNISAMFHNTGGGQTKCLGFGSKVQYVKDNLLPTPPIFDFIQRNGNISSREMLQIFNMGHRFEIVCDETSADSCISIGRSFGVAAQRVGHVNTDTRRSLKITLRGEVHEYDGERH